MRILIVEDQDDMAAVLERGLRGSFRVDIVSTGKEAIYSAQVNDYDLIILDLGLPDLEGKEVCRRLREQEVRIPLLVLTGRQLVDEKVAALDAGADDYLTKPFSFAELEARMRALLRRNGSGPASNMLTLGDLQLDTRERRVHRGGREIVLRRKEYELLEYLVRNEGRALSRDRLLEHVWDRGSEIMTNTVDVHIKYLRDKLDRPFRSHMIKTAYGIGYKIEVDH